MRREEIKVGQRVRVTARHGGVFYSYNEGEVGTVEDVRAGSVWVRFDHNGECDYGEFSDIELVTPEVVAPATIKEAIANVEAALAVLKDLVG